MKRLVLALIAVSAALLVASPAAAGGWAISSLDALPVAEPGESTAVGFTILQHGVSPVDMSDPVAIEVTAADGTVTSFAATKDGAPGHYVAHVTFPTAGEYTWRVMQGWFEPHDLGTITVGSSSSASVGGSSSSWTWVQPALLSATVLLAAVALVDLLAGHRRRATAAA